MRRASLLFSIVFFGLLAQPLLATQDIVCNVVIVGGGAGGLHTAYQLAKLPRQDPNSDVCVIEKERRLGGRIYDIPLDPTRPDLVYGMGALRVMENQHYLFKLADELRVELQFAPYHSDLINARGAFGFSSDDINNLAYPLVTKEFIHGGGSDTENGLYNVLLHGPERQNAAAYADLHSYVQATIGSQGYQFLRDVSRFRADFEEPIDARSYLEYLDEEWDTCCKPSYPVGGMSSFIKGMANGAQSRGVRFFLNQPAQSISTRWGFYPYEIRTPRYNFFARRVVIATEAAALKYITGDIAEGIKNQKPYQDILGIKVVTIAQKWPKAWWLNAGYAEKDVRRAWTTEHCLNFIEIPINPYAADQNVTRSVYNDDARCSRFWENTYQRLGIKAVEKEILRGLKNLFPNADIPQPLNTVVQIWPTAWHYLKAGTTYQTGDLMKWALEPIPGEEVSLVGESFNVRRSGWSEAAYKSSINLLNAKYGFHIEIPTSH